MADSREHVYRSYSPVCDEPYYARRCYTPPKHDEPYHARRFYTPPEHKESKRSWCYIQSSTMDEMKSADNEIRDLLIEPLESVVSDSKIKVQVPQGIDEKASEDDPACVICLDNKIKTVIVPCGHSCLCISCARHIGCDVLVQNNSKCPKCNTPFSAIIRIYNE